MHIQNWGTPIETFHFNGNAYHLHEHDEKDFATYFTEDGKMVCQFDISDAPETHSINIMESWEDASLIMFLLESFMAHFG